MERADAGYTLADPTWSGNISISTVTHSPAYELTVVAPAFNEAANVEPLVERVRAALEGVAWQLIIVDDNSPDGTAEAAKALAASDSRVTCIRRVGRRGLAGAVIEGMLASAAHYVAVIDADLQHDETLLPRMLAALRQSGADLAIGSRYVETGSAEAGLSPIRQAGSRLATRLAKLVLKAEVSDPVSGFFMIRREKVETIAPRLSSQGFKILFDIIASQPAPLKIVELPYSFAERQSGESKMGGLVVMEYLGLVLARLTGNFLTPRALLFFLVGGTGLAVNLAAYEVGRRFGLSFAVAQTVAGIVAMTSNFLINNQITYRDRRLKGLKLLIGYLRFCTLCGVGLVANVAVGDLVFHVIGIGWLASIAGALFGAVWNYVSTSLAVW